MRGKLSQRGDDGLDNDRGQALARLVDKQQPVVGHQRPGNGEHLLLAARELAAGQAIEALEIGE